MYVQPVSPLWRRKGKLPRNELLVQWRWKGEEGRGGDQVKRKTGEEDWNEERVWEREDRILSSEERGREKNREMREGGREEHPSRVQLRNGFGFVAAFWIKVREETIAVRSSLSISFSSFFFHWHSLSSYPLIIHVGVSDGTGEVILLASMSHVFAKSVNYCSADADFFERKNLEWPASFVFETELRVSVLERVTEWESKREPPLVTHRQNWSCSSLPFLCTSLMGKKKSIRKGQLIVDVKIVSRENCQDKEEEREGKWTIRLSSLIQLWRRWTNS